MKKAILMVVALMAAFQVSAMACGIEGKGSHAENGQAPVEETA